MAAGTPRPACAVGARGGGGAAAWSSSARFFMGSRSSCAAASIERGRRRRRRCAISCCSSQDGDGPRPAAPPTSAAPSDGSIQLYSQIERVITEAARQSREGWGSTGDWTEVEGAWVLRPKSSEPSFVVHFVGGIFVGAAPQITYRFFLERLADRIKICCAAKWKCIDVL
nr:unnamed protein product [Digitaria exilis]